MAKKITFAQSETEKREQAIYDHIMNTLAKEHEMYEMKATDLQWYYADKHKVKRDTVRIYLNKLRNENEGFKKKYYEILGMSKSKFATRKIVRRKEP